MCLFTDILARFVKDMVGYCGVHVTKAECILCKPSVMRLIPILVKVYTSVIEFLYMKVFYVFLKEQLKSWEAFRLQLYSFIKHTNNCFILLCISHTIPKVLAYISNGKVPACFR